MDFPRLAIARRRAAGLLLAVCLVAPLAVRAGEPAIEIAVLPRDPSDWFGRTLRLGAEEAAKAAGATVFCPGEGADARARQVAAMEAAQARAEVGVWVLAPRADRLYTSYVANANRHGAKVVLVQAQLDTSGHACLMASANDAAGRRAAEWLAGRLQGNGRLVLLRAARGDPESGAREAGFVAAIKPQAPRLMLVSHDTYAGMEAGEAVRAAQGLLRQVEDFDGVFCSDTAATLGMLRALRQYRLAGKVAFVGVGYDEALLEAVRAGELHLLLVEDARGLGRRAVEAGLALRRGEAVPKDQEVPFLEVGPDTLADPGLAALFAPAPPARP